MSRAQLSPSEPHVAIGQIPFFRQLDSADIIAMAQVSQARSYGAGDIVFYKGDEGDGLYALLSGQLNIYLPQTNHTPKTILKVLSPGEYFGEYSLFDGEPRSASVEAITAADTLFLPTAAFAVLLDKRKSVARAVVNNLGNTLLGHPMAELSVFEKDLIVSSQVPPTLKYMQLFCRLLRQANLRLTVMRPK
jgi:CRP-like cAMP-binding protein